MGLDTVELVISVEEEFGISLPDADAERMQTMGDLRDYLEDQLRTREGVNCRNQRAFYMLRRALMETGNFARNSVRLDSETRIFLPEKGKRKFWNKLGDHLECKLPELRLNSKIRIGMLFVFFAFPTAALFHFDPIDYALAMSFFALLLSSLIVTICNLILKKIPVFVTAVPGGIRTIRDLSIYVAQHKYLWKDNRCGDNVWDRLCKLVSEQAGVKEEELKPETHFIKDLFPYG